MKLQIYKVILFLFSGFLSLSAQSLTNEDIGKIRTLSEAIEESEKLLAKYPDQDFTPNLMFQLGELYVRRSRVGYERAMLRYEEAERKYDQGTLDHQPTVPEVDFKDALKIYYDLLKKYPNVPFRDKLLYRLALCHLEQGEKSEAVEHFQELALKTDDKQLFEEANFRIGEFYFEQKKIDQAIEHYSKLLDSWDSPYFGMALYKLGWCYYQVDEFAKAISTFIYLIEDVNLTNQVQSDALGKSQADLRQEAKEYVAICFAEYGGPEKAREFLTNKRDLPYVEDVLLHLAELYRERNYYDQAIATLHVLLDFYPDNPAAATYQKKIVENYELAEEKPKADQARVELIAKYGPGTEWLSRIPAGDSRDEVLAIAEEFQYTLGTEAQARAQETGDRFDYNLAINHYQDYLEKFPDAAHSAKVQFYLAECFYELEEFTDAARAYHDVNLRYPGSEFAQVAAYNRILAYNHLLQNSDRIDSTDCFLFSFLGDSTSGVHIIKTRSSEEAQVLQATNDFYLFHRSSPKMGEVLMNYGAMLYGLTEFDMAEQVYAKVIGDTSAARFHSSAYLRMAQGEIKQQNYTDAEDWCKRLITDFPDSSDQVKKAKEMMASARFKQAESLAARGDSLQAAQEFEAVAEMAADSSIAAHALFEAARKYEDLGNKKKAVALLERFPDRFPSIELTQQALFKAGLLCEELQQWERAAANYLRLYNLNGSTSPQAAKSLFFAARCYESMEDWEQARTYYNTYLKKHSDDPDRHLEAAFRKGEIAYQQNQFQTAQKDFEYVLEAHEKFSSNGGTVDNYIAANAQFLIAEILFKSFDDIRITPPLQRSLKRKRESFETLVKAYTRAAKFKVAEWTTASSYKIGFAFEEFASSLLESPRPDNLTGEALEQYNTKLRESVQPFMEKALEAYQANVRQATEHGIENQWVAESRKRIDVLMTELGHTTVSTSGS